MWQQLYSTFEQNKNWYNCKTQVNDPVIALSDQKTPLRESK